MGIQRRLADLVAQRRLGERLLWALYPLVYDSLWNAPLTTKVARLVSAHITPGQSVLEVGAGTGLFSAHIASVAGTFVPCEPNDRMADRIRVRVPGVEVLALSEEQLNPGEKFDIVVAANVVHLVANPCATVDRLLSLCRPDGSVLLATPHEQPGVLRAAGAHFAAGAGFLFCVRFVLIHLALAPVSMLAVRRRVRMDLGDPVAIVHGVTAIYCLPAP